MTKTFVSLFALIAATPALAQSNSTLPAENGDSDGIVVTATRSGDAIPIDLLGASVTVIDARAMEDRQTRVLSDVLRDVPGIAVSRIGAVGGQTQVRIRGAESNHTLTLVDGIKASDPYYGEFDFGTLIADEDTKIEILRGQQSALYGSDAIGGVINYITLTGAEAPGVKLRAEGGSFGTFNGAARVAGVSGNIDYVFSSSYVHTHGYPTAVGGTRDVGADSAGLSFKTIWTPTDNFHLTAVGRYNYIKADANDSDPDSFSPTFGITVDTPGAHYVNRAFYGLIRGQLNLLDGRWTNAVSAQIADTHRTGYDIANPFASPAGQTIVPAYGDKGRRLKGSYESAFRFGNDQIKHRVTVALDAEREGERSTISLFGADLGRRHRTNIGVVGQYDVTVNDRLALGASLRHDENDRFADPTTYRFQGSYKFDEGTRIHAAAGSGVKAPDFSDLYDFFAGQFVGNPHLQPEKSKGWEAGIEQNFAADHVTIGATWFDNRLRDVISTDFSTGVAMPINLPGKTKQQGVEVSATARFGDGWRFDASYTYLHSPQDRFVLIGGVGTTFDGQAVRRAKNIASANLTWAPADQPFSGTVTVRYNGAQNDVAFTDPSFIPLLVKLRSFTLVNANATYKLNAHVDLFARVENLLDRRYQEVFSFATPGRAGYGGVKVRF